MASYIECRFNENSLLQCYFLAILPAGSVKKYLGSRRDACREKVTFTLSFFDIHRVNTVMSHLMQSNKASACVAIDAITQGSSLNRNSEISSKRTPLVQKR